MKRFLEKVIQAPNCWIWKGAIATNGYGAFYFDKKIKRAHRVSYEIFNGPIPDGLVVDHICNNKLCVNPKHLQVLTSRENTFKDRLPITHCIHGHLLSKENVYLENRGNYFSRKCLICKKKSTKDSALRKKLRDLQP